MTEPAAPTPRSKFKKWLFPLLAILLLVVIVGPWVRDWAIRKSVEKTASMILGVPVRIGGFSLSLFSGRATVTGFRVANPPSCQKPDALKFTEITLDLDMGTLFSDEIVVEALLADGLAINYELQLDGSSNLGTLQKNAASFTGSGAPQEKKEDSASLKQQDAPQNVGKRLVIRHLTIKNTALQLTLFKMTAQMSLPDAEMTDVGQGKSLADTFSDLLTETLNAAGKAAAQSGLTTENLKKTGESLSESIKNSGRKLQDGAKNLFR